MRRLLRVLVAASVVLGVVVPIVGSPVSTPAVAADASTFDPGNLVSDQAFYDGAGMTSAEVQSFLVSKVPVCSTWHAGSGINQPPFTCLKDYSQSVPSMPADQYCKAISGGTMSAASLITAVAAACSINPKALLVLLEKEQSLITDTWPWAFQYNHATGFSCPDTAPCDPSFAGFFYQVYYGARQFQIYKLYPGSFNFRSGGTYAIQYHPNAACGTRTVTISNAATAGLYNYTPYTPNQAALANLNGSGDACSSYGNRNFWRLWSDWFGDPRGSSFLVRNATDATVYFLADGKKHPISRWSIAEALLSTGPIRVVTDAYLASVPTGPIMPRLVRDPGGTLYYISAGYKLPFSTCDLVADYGQSCSRWVQLSQVQADLLRTGPMMSSVLGDVTGRSYFVDNGVKHEVLDAATLAEAGLPLSFNVLPATAHEDIPVGTVLMRDGSIAKIRGTNSLVIRAGGSYFDVDAPTNAELGLASLASGQLDLDGVTALGARSPFVGLFKDSANVVTVLTGAGRLAWPFPIAASSIPTFPDAFIAQLPTDGSVAAGALVKGSGDGTIYLVEATRLRPIAYWSDVVALSSPNAPTFRTVPQILTAQAPIGPVLQPIGRLVRESDDATVYLIDGVDRRVPVGSYSVTNEYGISSATVVVAPGTLDAYAANPAVLGQFVRCGADTWVAMGGSLHRIAPAIQAAWSVAAIELTSTTCATFVIGHEASEFIVTPDLTIWRLDNGTKHPIASWAKFLALSGGSNPPIMGVSWEFANRFPTGDLLS